MITFSQGKNMTDRERIAQLEAGIAELKARLPKHSVPPAMILELEDLEDELTALQAQGNLEDELTALQAQGNRVAG